MKRTALTVAFVVLLSAFVATIGLLPEAKAMTRYVGGGGPGNYTSIQDAVDDANPGDTIFVYSGTYYESVKVNRTVSLIGEDRNTTIINGLGAQNVVLVNVSWANVTGFTVTNGVDGIRLSSSSFSNVEGNNVIANDRNGILVYSSSRNSIIANTVSSNRDGIRVALSSQNTVLGNTVSSNTPNGIIQSSSSNNNVTGNDVYSNDVGIYLYTSSDNITGNNVSHNRLGIFLHGSSNSTISENNLVSDGVVLWGDQLSHFNSHTIPTSNMVNGKPLYYHKDSSGFDVFGIQVGQLILANCTDVNVRSLQINDTDAGLEVAHSSNITITGNNVTSNQYGVYLLFSLNSNIGGNNASDNRYGIRLFSSQENRFTGNNLSSNTDFGIYLESSSNNQIRGNKISSGTVEGIRLGYSHNNTISNNSAYDNRYGMYLIHSDNNTVINNTISSNIWSGFYSYSSSESHIAGNNIFDNRDGVYLDDSVGSRIYHNIFSNNTNQAYDNTNANQWDDGYPFGGNSWSDYVGSDFYSGENQNLPGRDGIGDTPHIIDFDTADRYPLLVENRSLFPSPPEITAAILSGKDFENVTFSWDLSADEANGTIAGYDVYRGTVHSSIGSDYLLVDTLATGTSSWTDVGSGDGDTDNYFYVVCALNDFNLSSCAYDQAAKFVHPAGWPLISIPLIQSNESIERVLQTVEYDKAWYYDSLDQEWKWHMPFKGYRRGLWSINHTMGLWVNYTAGSYVTVAGMVPTETSIQLYKGWNLVSFPSFNSTYTVADIKAEIGATRVEGYGLVPPYNLRVLGDADVLQAGYGYWVRVDAGIDWTVEVS